MAKKYLCDLAPGDKIYHASIYNSFTVDMLNESMRKKCRRHRISTYTLNDTHTMSEIYEDDVLAVNDLLSPTGTNSGMIIITFGNSYININKNMQSAVSTELFTGSNTRNVYATNKEDLLEELYDLTMTLKELSMCEYKHKNDCYKEILKKIRNEKDK